MLDDASIHSTYGEKVGNGEIYSKRGSGKLVRSNTQVMLENLKDASKWSLQQQKDLNLKNKGHQ